jgi:hypothetical protein
MPQAALSAAKGPSAAAMAEAKSSRINAFGIAFEGKSGVSTAEFSWAA